MTSVGVPFICLALLVANAATTHGLQADDDAPLPEFAIARLGTGWGEPILRDE